MKNFSCSFSRLYARGGFYEDAAVSETFIDNAAACRWVGNVYPPYTYDRPQPVHVLSPDSAFAADVVDQCRDLNAQYTRGSSTDVFLLENCVLFNRSLYNLIDGQLVQMYETNMPNDRVWRKDLDPASDLHDIVQPEGAAVREFLYLGSIGSANYGHWIIDDLTRAKAIIDHFPRRQIPVIVLDSYNPTIDSVRVESLRALICELADIEVLVVDFRTTFLFPRLYFVSPSSFHPILKSPAGATFLREHFIAQAARMPDAPAGRAAPKASKALFVTRRAEWRSLLNLDAVSAYFADLAFEIIELDGMSFVEQVRTFSRAEIIVGVMGAGMTNVVFSPLGATVIHLAPQGWLEPFFWDLAAVNGQRYAIAFGCTENPDMPARSSYTIDSAQLDVIKAWL